MRPDAGAWRLLRDGGRDGAWNMAVDEALLDIRGSGGVRPNAPAPTLRLYGWDPPALSLGRSQPPAFDADYLEERHVEVVRRPTGGLAVLHDRERTYAVCGALRSTTFPGGVVDTYGRIATALAAGLRVLGVDASMLQESRQAAAPAPRGTETACFNTTAPHEFAVGGRKLVGSAQLRRRGAFLQHGSLPLAFDTERTSRALGTADVQATDLAAVLGRMPEDDEIDEALVEGFAATFGVPLVPAELTEDEQLRAAQLYSWKYSSLAWTLDGRYGDRERRWGPLGR